MNVISELDFSTSTLVLIMFEVSLLSFQVIHVIARWHDKSRVRFLFLIVFFVQYNLLVELLPNLNLSANSLTQNIIVYISTFSLVCYGFYYIITTLKLQQLKLYKIKVLVITLVVSFLCVFLGSYFIFADVNLSRQLASLIPILISIYFYSRTSVLMIQKWRVVVSKNRIQEVTILAGSVGLLIISLIPVLYCFENFGYTSLSMFFINLALIIIGISYFKNYFHQAKMEYDFLNKVGYDPDEDLYEKEMINNMFDAYHLTARELDVAKMILQGKSYNEIAELTGLVPKTVSKHASNIFKKTKNSKKAEFVSQFNSEA